MKNLDSEEKVIRFGCGFLFGTFILAGRALVQSLDGGYYGLAFAILVGIAAGICAVRLGDTFWKYLINSSWWRW
jgi:hypothetical protein